ncbi:MAG: hypothetical protein ABH832_04735 [bacterium]
MNMFEKEKTVNNNSQDVNAGIKMEVMPDEFYGGINPVVKFKDVTKEVDLDTFKTTTKTTTAEKSAFDKSAVKGKGSTVHPSNFLMNKKIIIMGGIGLFIVFIMASAGYYFVFSKPGASGQPTLTTTTSVQIAKPNNGQNAPLPATTTTSSVAQTPATSTVSISAIVYPSELLLVSNDMDADNLTDEEERAFKTDPGIFDSDLDGYPDGHEVYYLYNPIGVEPKRIIESDAIQLYINPVFGCSLYYPIEWSVGNVDKDHREVLFSASNGEYIELRIISMQSDETLSDWFGKWASSQNYDALIDFTGVFMQNGKKRSDNLVYYFMDQAEQNVYVLVYHPSQGSNVISYKAVEEMMARSMRLSDNSYVKQWATDRATTSTNLMNQSNPATSTISSPATTNNTGASTSTFSSTST